MNQPFKTGLAAFARSIYQSKILCYVKDKEIKSLSINSLDTEVREAWKEIKEERKNVQRHRK